MPCRQSRRTNRQSRKWYARICLVTITDSSPSSESESETDGGGGGGSDTPHDLSRPPPSPETENTTPQSSPSQSETDEIDWRFPPPPPSPSPPLPMLTDGDEDPRVEVEVEGEIRVVVEVEAHPQYYYRSGSGGRNESVMCSIRITEEYKRERYSECPICKEELKVGEEARELRCKHSFCSNKCIGRWLTIKQNCPVCWRSLYSSPPPPSTFSPALQDAEEYEFPSIADSAYHSASDHLFESPPPPPL